MSFSTALVRAQMVGQVTAFEISITDLKSPGLDIGNPASITSTPKASSCFATSIFSTVLSWHPGTCSPSRRVVSNIKSLLFICLFLFTSLVSASQVRSLCKITFFGRIHNNNYVDIANSSDMR